MSNAHPNARPTWFRLSDDSWAKIADEYKNGATAAEPVLETLPIALPTNPLSSPRMDWGFSVGAGLLGFLGGPSAF
jgi:hypothetical protein